MSDTIDTCDDAVAKVIDQQQQISQSTPSDLLTEIASLIERCHEIKEELNHRHANINLIDSNMARIASRMVRIGQAHRALSEDPTNDVDELEEARAELRIAFDEMMPGTPGNDEEYLHRVAEEKKKDDEARNGDTEENDHVFDSPAYHSPSIPSRRLIRIMNLDGSTDLSRIPSVPVLRPTERFTPADLAGVYANMRSQAVALKRTIANTHPLDHEQLRQPAVDLVVVIYKTRDRYKLLINDARDHGELSRERAEAACAEVERELTEIARGILDVMMVMKLAKDEIVEGAGNGAVAAVEAGAGAGVGPSGLPGDQTESAAGELMMSGALLAPDGDEAAGCDCGGACGGSGGGNLGGSCCGGSCGDSCGVQK